jgi:hypothetical protein
MGVPRVDAERLPVAETGYSRSMIEGASELKLCDARPVPAIRLPQTRATTALVAHHPDRVRVFSRIGQP